MKAASVAIAIWIAGCSCDWRLERMQAQPRVAAYADDSDRIAIMVASSPTAGTVPRQTVSPELAQGCAGASYVAESPVEVSDDVLKTGRERFRILCATCHGARGIGDSAVARAMEKTKPSSLVIAPVRGYPAGRLFRTITLGYKFMPSYRNELDLRERWATVAYVQRLPESQPESPFDAGVPAPVRPGPTCPEEAP